MTSQIVSVVRSAYFHLKWIAQLHPYLDTGSLTTLVHVLVDLRLDSCNAFYVGLPLGLLWRLQWVQKVAASQWGQKIPPWHITLLIFLLPYKFQGDGINLQGRKWFGTSIYGRVPPSS